MPKQSGGVDTQLSRSKRGACAPPKVLLRVPVLALEKKKRGLDGDTL
jgi:hypothetical protein